MKRLIKILPILLVMGLTTGCGLFKKQSQGTVISPTLASPTVALEEQAAEALTYGQYERVEEILALAQPTVTGKLLLAEAKLQQGNLPEALSYSQEVLSAKNAGQQVQAQAHEIIAKAQIRQAQWPEALNNLDQAGRKYHSDQDLKRVSDLTALTQGLLAYSQANVSLARKYWASIEGLELKSSLSQFVDQGQDSASW